MGEANGLDESHFQKFQADQAWEPRRHLISLPQNLPRLLATKTSEPVKFLEPDQWDQHLDVGRHPFPAGHVFSEVLCGPGHGDMGTWEASCRELQTRWHSPAARITFSDHVCLLILVVHDGAFARVTNSVNGSGDCSAVYPLHHS